MRILIVTGSSGGHIFPALALADLLKNANHQVKLVLPEDGRESKIPVDFVQVEYIQALKIDFSLDKKNILGVYHFFWGAWQALRIIIKFKPLVVVGFGSLNSISLIFWAWLFRIKTIIHEQNVVCGRANRLLSKFVDRVTVSFSQSCNYLNVSREKIILTGNPLRKELVQLKKEEALDFFKFKTERFTILITGGSQGSHRLNVACFEALSACQKELDLQIIHICGAADFIWLQDRYAGTALIYQLFNFFATMQYAYSAADLIICRAGATTIAELQKFKVPAILLPYPFAYAHQLANAQVLKNIGAAEVFLDTDLCADKLKEKLQEYYCNQELLKLMQKAYQKLPVLDAAALLANEVERLN